MFVGKVFASTGNVAKVFDKGEWKTSASYLIYGATEDDVRQHAKQVVSSWKFERAESAIEEMSDALQTIHECLHSALSTGEKQVTFSTHYDPYEYNPSVGWKVEEVKDYTSVEVVRVSEWQIDNIDILGDRSFLPGMRQYAGTSEFYKGILRQMEWNCLPSGKFEDKPYVSFDITGIIVDSETDQVTAVDVDHPGITQWSIYGRTEEALAWAMHDCDSLEDAKLRATLLARVYQ